MTTVPDPPSVCYLVLAHQNPDQVARLLRRLTAHGSAAVVHVDAKTALEPFTTAAAGCTGVHFTTRRHKVYWAAYSMIQAELEMLRVAIARTPADCYVLLSGSDYPIKPEPVLREEMRSGAVYIEYFPLLTHLDGKFVGRLERWRFPSTSRGRRVAKFWNEFLSFRLPRRNVEKGLGGRTPYYGSAWWALTHQVAVDLLDVIDTDARLVRLYRHSHHPDEGFVQTVVMSLSRRPQIRAPLTFADWSRSQRHGASPAVLAPADIAMLDDLPEHFARKFDLYRDPTVLDELDSRFC